jgi:hypothetical protein
MGGARRKAGPLESPSPVSESEPGVIVATFKRLDH